MSGEPDSGQNGADNPPGKRKRGRPRGSGTKRSGRVNVQVELLGVYQGLGGAKALLEWAKDNPRNQDIFYRTILPKVMQKESDAPEDKRDHAGGPILDKIDGMLKEIKESCE